MEIIALIIFIIITAIGVFLGHSALKLQKKVKRQGAIIVELTSERAKQSDQLRLKETELKKYSNVEIKVPLTALEKKMVLNALDTPQFKGKVHDPKTKHVIRQIYGKLVEKIKESIKE